MSHPRRNPRRRRPFLDPLEGRALLSRLSASAEALRHLQETAEIERAEAYAPVRADADRDDARDDRLERASLARLASRPVVARGVASDGAEAGASSREESEDWPTLASAGTWADEIWSGRDEDLLESRGSNLSPVLASATVTAVVSPSAFESRPAWAWSSATIPLPVPMSLPTAEGPRSLSGRVAAKGGDGDPVGEARADAPGGDPGDGDASPVGDGPIADVAPSDRSPLDLAVARFLGRLDDLDVRRPEALLRVSMTLAVVAGAVALVVARRRYRSLDDVAARGDLLAAGFPQWPARPR